MRVLSWNIQAGLGVDGRVDLGRTVEVIRALGDADVICLQEVSRHVPGPEGQDMGDQAARLTTAFPGYMAVFGAAVDRLRPEGSRMRFGNLLLSRLPVMQCFRHPLPQPADPSTRHMPRQATEVVLAAAWGAVRVVTAHLEYHSQLQRVAQVRRLLDLEAELREAQAAPPVTPASGLYAGAPRPPSTVLCGDFNFGTADLEYAMLTRGGAALTDAWTAVHPGRDHAPTCGVHDREQWPQGPHCRDFFFLSADLAPRACGLDVDVATAASDHQPLLLRLDGRAPGVDCIDDGALYDSTIE